MTRKGSLTTHTFATLEVSAGAYDEILAKLEAAGYGHALIVETPGDHPLLDMHGIALERGTGESGTVTILRTDLDEAIKGMLVLGGVLSAIGLTQGSRQAVDWASRVVKK